MVIFTAWEKLPRKHPARRKGYKYRTTEEVVYKSDLLARTASSKILISSHGYVVLKSGGTIHIRTSYHWDGASGPTFDTANTMLGSLVHDALYQLMREDLIPRTGEHSYKDVADMLLRRICIEQGMSKWRANLWTWAVLSFGSRSAGG